MNIKNRKQQGFTIIEVLIVLAIAGLIMLVVFLAVPALQRNQRNSGRRTDASRIAAAANDFVTNSNGTTPSSAVHAQSISDSAGTLSNLGTLAGVAGGTCAAGDMAAASLTICNANAVSAFTAIANDGVVLATNARCSGNAGVSASGNAREMAIVFTIETTTANRTFGCINV